MVPIILDDEDEDVDFNAIDHIVRLKQARDKIEASRSSNFCTGSSSWGQKPTISPSNIVPGLPGFTSSSDSHRRQVFFHQPRTPLQQLAFAPQLRTPRLPAYQAKHDQPWKLSNDHEEDEEALLHALAQAESLVESGQLSTQQEGNKIHDASSLRPTPRAQNTRRASQQSLLTPHNPFTPQASHQNLKRSVHSSNTKSSSGRKGTQTAISFGQGSRFEIEPSKEDWESFRKIAIQNNSRLRAFAKSIPLVEEKTDSLSVPINENVCATWVYPDRGIGFRKYQFDIVRKCLLYNTLVAIPVGTGKTVIAAVVIFNFLRWFPSGQCIFIANTKQLVKQQLESIKSIASLVGLPTSEMAVVEGKNAKGRSQVWEANRVLFSTGVTVSNDAKQKRFKRRRVVLVVIDEAHHATGKDGMAKMISQIQEAGHPFRVVALTATPDTNGYKIVKNLRIAQIEQRSVTHPDLQSYIHERDVTKIVVRNDWAQRVTAPLRQLMLEFVGELEKRNVDIGPNRDPQLIASFTVSEDLTRFIRNPTGPPPQFGGNMSSHIQAVKHHFSCLHTTAHLVERIRDHGIKEFLQQIKSYESGDQAWRYKYVLRSPKVSEAKREAEKLSRDPEVQENHPKVGHVVQQIQKHFEQCMAESNGPQSASEWNVSTRVIVFCELKQTCDIIVEALGKRVPQCRPYALRALSPEDPKEFRGQHAGVLQAFREGKFLTLVSTSIGQEGLDFGNINMVINFTAPGTGKMRTQRCGRTARRGKGYVVDIVSGGAEDRRCERGKRQMWEQSKKMASLEDATHVWQKTSEGMNGLWLRPKGIGFVCRPLSEKLQDFDFLRNQNKIFCGAEKLALRKRHGLQLLYGKLKRGRREAADLPPELPSRAGHLQQLRLARVQGGARQGDDGDNGDVASACVASSKGSLRFVQVMRRAQWLSQAHGSVALTDSEVRKRKKLFSLGPARDEGASETNEGSAASSRNGESEARRKKQQAAPGMPEARGVPKRGAASPAHRNRKAKRKQKQDQAKHRSEQGRELVAMGHGGDNARPRGWQASSDSSERVEPGADSGADSSKAKRPKGKRKPKSNEEEERVPKEKRMSSYFVSTRQAGSLDGKCGDTSRRPEIIDGFDSDLEIVDNEVSSERESTKDANAEVVFSGAAAPPPRPEKSSSACQELAHLLAPPEALVDTESAGHQSLPYYGEKDTLFLSDIFENGDEDSSSEGELLDEMGACGAAWLLGWRACTARGMPPPATEPPKATAPPLVGGSQHLPPSSCDSSAAETATHQAEQEAALEKEEQQQQPLQRLTAVLEQPPPLEPALETLQILSTDLRYPMGSENVHGSLSTSAENRNPEVGSPKRYDMRGNNAEVVAELLSEKANLGAPANKPAPRVACPLEENENSSQRESGVRNLRVQSDTVQSDNQALQAAFGEAFPSNPGGRAPPVEESGSPVATIQSTADCGRGLCEKAAEGSSECPQTVLAPAPQTLQLFSEPSLDVLPSLPSLPPTCYLDQLELSSPDFHASKSSCTSSRRSQPLVRDASTPVPPNSQRSPIVRSAASVATPVPQIGESQDAMEKVLFGTPAHLGGLKHKILNKARRKKNYRRSMVNYGHEALPLLPVSTLSQQVQAQSKSAQQTANSAEKSPSVISYVAPSPQPPGPSLLPGPPPALTHESLSQLPPLPSFQRRPAAGSLLLNKPVATRPIPHQLLLPADPPTNPAEPSPERQQLGSQPGGTPLNPRRKRRNRAKKRYLADLEDEPCGVPCEGCGDWRDGVARCSLCCAAWHWDCVAARPIGPSAGDSARHTARACPSCARGVIAPHACYSLGGSQLVSGAEKAAGAAGSDRPVDSVLESPDLQPSMSPLGDPVCSDAISLSRQSHSGQSLPSKSPQFPNKEGLNGRREIICTPSQQRKDPFAASASPKRALRRLRKRKAERESPGLPKDKENQKAPAASKAAKREKRKKSSKVMRLQRGNFLDIEAVDDDAWGGDEDEISNEETTDEDEYFNNSFIDDGESQSRRESTSSLTSLDTMYLQSLCSPALLASGSDSRRGPRFANDACYRSRGDRRLQSVTNRLERQLALEAHSEEEVFVKESEDDEDEVSMLWGSGGEERLVREIKELQEAKREKRQKYSLAAVRAHAEKWKSGVADNSDSSPLSESSAKSRKDSLGARQPQKQSKQKSPHCSVSMPSWKMAFETTEEEEADMMALMDALEQRQQPGP